MALPRLADQSWVKRVDGKLRLGFAYDYDRQMTHLANHEQQPPLQVIRAFPLTGGASLVHLHNLSGGVLGGDQLALDVDIGPQARVQLTSTSSTRLYRCREHLPPAQQTTVVRIQEGALLEYVSDPLVPFAGSRYQQQTCIELAQDAGLFWWEIIAPGRSARGECFAYDLLQLNLDISAQGKLLALERMKLEPQCRPLSSLVRLGAHSYFASFYICRVGVAASRWLELEHLLSQLADQLTCPGVASWGVSALVAHGLVIRAISKQGRQIAPGLETFWKAAKVALYGEEAIVPRKIY